MCLLTVLQPITAKHCKNETAKLIEKST
jgi:hypothetical protein